MTEKPALRALQRLADWDGLSRLDEMLANLRRRANFFLIAPRVLRVEGVHSDMLAWLLDPAGWHGLGGRFAGAFVRAVHARCGLQSGESVAITEVHREFSTGFGPVDLLLVGNTEKDRFVVGIENKIDSPEGPEQLNRYARGLTHLFGPDKVTLVYLTPTGDTPSKSPALCRFTTVSYTTAANLLETAIAEAPRSSAHATGLALAEHYVAALRTHIMPDANPDIDGICRQLYRDHQEAWRAIRRRLPSQRDEAHAQIGARVCKRLEADYGGLWQFAVRRDRYACVFRPGWHALGVYEADPIIGLDQTSGAQSTYAKVHFRLVADSSDTDAGERYDYQVRLKMDRSDNPQLGEAVVTAIKGLPGEIAPTIPDRSQFTLKLKSTNRLPGLGEGPEGVPDSVVDWFARHVEHLVPMLDRVLPPT